jgi:intergrase/recombinase
MKGTKMKTLICQNCGQTINRKSPVTPAKIRKAQKTLIHFCVQNGITNANDVGVMLNKVSSAKFSPVQVAGVKAAMTKGQRIPFF